MFRITNISALNSLTTQKLNSKTLDTSLQRLSSGLKINSSFDDASGLSISNNLNSSANTLEQSISNSMDASSMLKIADKAMDAQSQILDTIKVKATAAAQDGQSVKTRKMLLADIQRLLEEYDTIANTTTYNSLSLLNGAFSNKVFEIGSNSNTTIKTSINATNSSKIGITQFNTSAGIGLGDIQGPLTFKITNSITQKDYILNSDFGVKKGLGELAEKINQISDLTGVKAFIQNEYVAENQVRAGTLNNSFTINGVSFGQIEVEDGDESGVLVASINSLKDVTGVSARTENGRLILSAINGGGIILGGVDGRTQTILQLPPTSVVAAKTFPPAGFAKGALLINGVEIEASANAAAAVANINAVYDKTGVYAVLKDGKIHFLTKTSQTLLEMTGSASGQLGIDFRTVQGTAVAKDTTVRRDANRAQTWQLVYINKNNQEININLQLPPKRDGRYNLQDLVDAINSSNSGFKASIKEVDTNSHKLVLEAPEDMLRFRGFSTIGSSKIQTGNANTLGVENTIFDNPKLATTTNYFESFGRLSLSYAVGSAQTSVFYQGVKTNAILGLDLEQENLARSSVSLKELVSMSDEKLSEALGVFSASDKTTKSLADKNVLSLRRAMALMDLSENALTNLSAIRADIGSVQIQLNSTVNNIMSTQINLKAAASRIKDLDFAEESANFSKHNVFTQANSVSLYNILNLQEKMLTLCLESIKF